MLSFAFSALFSICHCRTVVLYTVPISRSIVAPLWLCQLLFPIHELLVISWRLRCEHSSPLCCAGRPEHLVHTLGGPSGECPRCGYGEPCTVQIVALSSCRWPCVLDFVVDIARQCRFVSACTQLFSTFIVSLVSGFKPRSSTANFSPPPPNFSSELPVAPPIVATSCKNKQSE